MIGVPETRRSGQIINRYSWGRYRFNVFLWERDGDGGRLDFHWTRLSLHFYTDRDPRSLSPDNCFGGRQRSVSVPLSEEGRGRRDGICVVGRCREPGNASRSGSEVDWREDEVDGYDCSRSRVLE